MTYSLTDSLVYIVWNRTQAFMVTGQKRVNTTTFSTKPCSEASWPQHA